MNDKDKRPFEEAISSLEHIKKYGIDRNVNDLSDAVKDIVNTLISLLEEIKESN